LIFGIEPFLNNLRCTNLQLKVPITEAINKGLNLRRDLEKQDREQTRVQRAGVEKKMHSQFVCVPRALTSLTLSMGHHAASRLYIICHPRLRNSCPDNIFHSYIIDVTAAACIVCVISTASRGYAGFNSLNHPKASNSSLNGTRAA